MIASPALIAQTTISSVEQLAAETWLTTESRPVFGRIVETIEELLGTSALSCKLPQSKCYAMSANLSRTPRGLAALPIRRRSAFVV